MSAATRRPLTLIPPTNPRGCDKNGLRNPLSPSKLMIVTLTVEFAGS